MKFRVAKVVQEVRNPERDLLMLRDLRLDQSKRDHSLFVLFF